MTKLYRHALSGHSHRAELFLSLIGRPAELVDVDLLAGEQRSEAFRTRNPFGQVPVLEDEGHLISDSNAILIYLAERYADAQWYPRDPAKRAEIQRWLSVAAGEIAQGPAAARLVTVFGATLDHERAKAGAESLFSVMEPILQKQSYLTGESATIADIASYAYIAHAPEGGVSLAAFPAIRIWLSRIEALPGFVAMQATKVSLAA